MTEALITRLRYILSRNCLWLDLLKEPTIATDMITSGPLIFNVPTDTIVLRIKRNYKGFRKNRLIRISERQLDDAVKFMIRDPKFKCRYDEGTITVNDVEELVKVATYGTLSLDLFEY